MIPATTARARALETDALLGSFIELARLTDTPVPTLEAVYALTTLLGRPLQAGV
jgi:2-dehydropantoate 2-reductase